MLNKKVNKQEFSMVIGLVIVVAHVLLSGFMIFFFERLIADAPTEEIKIKEISLPLTVAYVSAIVTWFFATGGKVSSRETVGMPLVIMVAIIVGAMLVSVFAVPIMFIVDEDTIISQLNDTFLLVEMAFGGIFGIVMSELFGYQRKAAKGS